MKIIFVYSNGRTYTQTGVVYDSIHASRDPITQALTDFNYTIIRRLPFELVAEVADAVTQVPGEGSFIAVNSDVTELQAVELRTTYTIDIEQAGLSYVVIQQPAAMHFNIEGVAVVDTATQNSVISFNGDVDAAVLADLLRF